MDYGKLYIIATPIGNLADITLRALDTLKSADFILCEDTRVTKNLLAHYKISKPLISYHQHSDAKKVAEIKELLSGKKNLALVSDAGTPGISDPGNLLINQLTISARGGPAFGWSNEQLTIIPIPGACAAVAALSVSGFPTDKYIFMGFPPHKNKRQKYFKEAATAGQTVVFYESGHRIKKCLAELKTYLEPKRQIIVCRELTKMFETIYRGTVDEVIETMKEERGEFVVVISNLKN
jgi:16S rRNA (cytidine1402-2'-O)-methyltransferase